jgi:hypothetical protein
MRAFMGLRHLTNIRWIGLSGARLFQPRTLKDRRKRRTTAVRERYTPVARLCAMNPRTAMDCIACARMPTAAWSMPVAAQK